MAHHIAYFLIKETNRVIASTIESSLNHIESHLLKEMRLFEKIYGPVEILRTFTEIEPPEVTMGITSEGKPAVNGMQAEIAPGPDGQILLITENRQYITDVKTFWATYRQGVHPNLDYIQQLEQIVAYYRRELEWLINFVDNLPPDYSQVKTLYIIRDTLREMLDGPSR